MPSGSFRLQDFRRPAIFYVSRSKYGPNGSQGQSSSVPLISGPRSAVSRYSRGVVENITINIDDQASIATVRFPKDLHDVSSGNIVGDQIKIRLARFEGFPSEVIFRGIVISPNLELSPNADGIAYDCVGFRFLLNSDVIFGRYILKDDGTVERDDFAAAIFNKDSLPNRSNARKTVSNVGNFYVFDEGGDDAQLWKVSDILEYIFVGVAGVKVSTAVNTPDRSYIGALDSVPKHFELQNEQIATAITRCMRQMGSAYHWWLDDFFSNQGGAQSNFKWFVIGGVENTNAGQRMQSISASGVIQVGGQSGGARSVRRVFTIGKLPNCVDDHPEYNVASMSIVEDGSDIVNRLIVIGDFVRIETVFKLTQDWTETEENELQAILPGEYPGIKEDTTSPETVTQFKTGLRDAKLANVFRHFKLDAVDTSAIFDEIESKLDSEFGKPKNLSGEEIDWFDRENLPAFDRDLTTEQEDVNGKKKKIRMQVYGYTDFRKSDGTNASILIEDGFVSWSLGTGANSYVIDPKQPKVRFKTLVADADLLEPGTIFVTAVLRTNVRIFHDTGFVGDSRINVTRQIEDERFKKILRFKSLAPEREVEGEQAAAFDSPDRVTVPISIVDYQENDGAGNEEDKETGYLVKSETEEIVRDDQTELENYANDTLDALQKVAVETSISLPFPSASYKPGELIKSVINSGYKNFRDSTIVGISIDGSSSGYRTTINTTNKKD